MLQYGDTELYYRIVNMRDAEIHSMQQITAANYNQYTYPQVGIHPSFTPQIVNLLKDINNKHSFFLLYKQGVCPKLLYVVIPKKKRPVSYRKCETKVRRQVF